jgi:MarR family transcriptional regulator, organic hydroperoxide resistance regulator
MGRTAASRARTAARAAGQAEDAGVGHRQDPRLEQRISFLVHRINARIAQVANRLFRHHELDLFSSRILVFLVEHREMRVGELVDAMALPQSTISHQLQRLEKRKLIRRRRTREDNRSVAVVLTPQGEAVARECNQLSLAVYGTMIEDLDDADVETLLRLLGTIFASLGRFDAAPPEGADAAEAAGDGLAGGAPAGARSPAR